MIKTITAIGALTFLCARPVFASNPANTTAGASLGSARTWAPASRRFADSSIFAPLTVPPAPSSTRLATGAPGPKYWQNRADYDLHATLDTVTGTVQGTMTLRYTNHSPDILPFIWFQTEQNAFRGPTPDSATANPYGDHIDQFTEVVNGHPTAVRLEEHQSETKVTLPQPLRSGETAIFHVTWHFLVPDRTNLSADGLSQPEAIARGIMAVRMGREQSLYQIAQWYPRVNVYDDVKGWNSEPYDGRAEFYLEYGTYTLAVTVPADYIVSATGALTNPQDVLTPTERARLAQAARADTSIAIVTAAELSDGAAHRKHDGMVTWKFHADRVRDAVWAASPQYQWDATSWHGILAQSFYRPNADSEWQHGNAALKAQRSIQEYSERWYPYPYPQISVDEGMAGGIAIGGMHMDGGMEYPMLSFNSQGDFGLLTHEIGHNWFPMIVGSNERVYEWMDEGFNTFINAFARNSPEHTQDPVIGHLVYTGTGTRRPPVGGSYGGTAYILQLLRRDILGPAVFDSAFRTYIRRWAYKHPTPQDFFRTMEDVSGKHLEWFWRECFVEASRFDQSIDSVTQTVQGNDTHVTVTYGNKGRAVMPLLVRFTFSDSTTRDVSYPADVWRADPTRYTMAYTFPQSVGRIELDPDEHLPDAERANNSWTAP